MEFRFSLGLILPNFFRNMKPIYEMAVMNVKRLYPDAQDARVSSGDLRFRKTLSAALWEESKGWATPGQIEEGKIEFRDSWNEAWRPRFIPDLWWIDGPNKAIHLYEIEDTHPLTEEKLLLLERYWWHMDAIDWDLTLTVFDRYGLNSRPLDLTQYAMQMLSVIRSEYNK